MDDRPSRLPLWLGIALLACGWAVIALGWYQAGRQELETGQLPYVLSGGFGGLGLLLMGAAGLIVDAVRQAGWQAGRASRATRNDLEDVRRSLTELAEAGEAERPRTARPRRRAARSS